MTAMRTDRFVHAAVLVACLGSAVLLAQSASPLAPDKDGEKWVQATLRKMTLDEKVGQMLVTSFQSNYVSTDSKTFDDARRRSARARMSADSTCSADPSRRRACCSIRRTEP